MNYLDLIMRHLLLKLLINGMVMNDGLLLNDVKRMH